MPIINKGAVSPKALAIPIIAPVSIPGIARGNTWCKTTCIGEAPPPMPASRIDGGTDLIAALLEIIIVGKVINVRTKPPTSGTERGTSKKLMKTAKPNNPKIIDGTAARLLILTSMKLVHLLRSANS